MGVCDEMYYSPLTPGGYLCKGQRSLMHMLRNHHVTVPDAMFPKVASLLQFDLHFSLCTIAMSVDASSTVSY